MIPSTPLRASALREKYLRFFKSKGHLPYPSGSLIPYDVTGRLDESLLFNGAGMVQFKPYFRGVAQPESKRLTNAQKCVRTGDIDEVGDLTHLTFFEMMGNFSFGDYFKKEAIAYSWEFITSQEWLGLDPRKVSYTVFEDDDEAYDNWVLHLSAAGIDPATRIFRLGEDTNYWPAGAFSNGPPGPCGPNSEMFYWTAGDPPAGAYSREDWLRDEAEGKWLEFWNDVFIQFEWQGSLRNPARPTEGYIKTGMPPLPFASVDTGMGLERTATVLGGLKSLYDIDIFEPIIRKIEQVAEGGLGGPPKLGDRDAHSVRGWDGPSQNRDHEQGELGRAAPATYKYGADAVKDVATRIIADHIRTAVFCISDGVLPGNNGRGYVLRRLIRRAVLKGQRVLGIEQPFFHLVYEGVLESMGDHYRELHERRDVIVETLRNEEALFRRTLRDGSQLLLDQIALLQRSKEFVQSLESTQVRFLGYLAEGLTLELAAQASDLKPDLRIRAYEDILSKARTTSREVAWRLLDPYLAPLKIDPRNYMEVLLRDYMRGKPLVLAGNVAFRLYDTYGFPLEVTKELCAEAGVEVDEAGYEHALLEAQERSRHGTERESVYGGVQIQISFETGDGKPTPTVFRGYDQTHTQSKIIGALFVPEPPPPTPSSSNAQTSPQEEGASRLNTQHSTPHTSLAIALDETPFYAESGGQVGDTGTISGGGFEGRVVDVIKQNGVFVHEVEPIKLPIRLQGESPEEAAKLIGEKLFNLPVEAQIDVNRRARTMRNHTATHLLHAALRQILGKHVTQAGSYVGPDHLRFDFTHGKPMTPEEMARVEVMVNEQALKNTPVITHADLAIAEAKAKGAMALFGEKYGDKVRMVEIGDFSRELCGGTHVLHTGEIGLFKVTSESSAASGVRRIEAVTGEGAYAWVLEQTGAFYEAASKLKSAPREVLHAIDRLQEQLREEKRRREKAETALARGESGAGTNQTQEIKGVFLWTRKFEDVDQKIAAAAVDDAVAQNPDLVALAAVTGDRIVFISKAGSRAVEKGAHAGNLVKEVSKIAGGGGGGRAEFATAGGKDASKIDDALAAATDLLTAML